MTATCLHCSSASYLWQKWYERATSCQSHDFFIHVLPSHFRACLSKFMEYLERVMVQVFFEDVERKGDI